MTQAAASYREDVEQGRHCGRSTSRPGCHCIRGRTGITLANGVRHSRGVDNADQTAPTFHKEFAVPDGGGWQPDFGSNFRVGHWPERDENPTVTCGLCCSGDVMQVRHLVTRCLGEERDGDKEEQAHAYKLIRSGASTVRSTT